MSDDPNIERSTSDDEMSEVTRLRLTFPSSGVVDLDAMLKAIRNGNQKFDLETIRTEIAASAEAQKSNSADSSEDDNGPADIDAHLRNSVQSLFAEIENILADQVQEQNVENLHRLISISIRLGAVRKEQQLRAKVLNDVKRGNKVRRGAQSGGDGRKGKFGNQTHEILRTMEALISDGTSQRNAATIAYKRKLGTSPEANLQLHKRHQKRQK